MDEPSHTDRPREEAALLGAGGKGWIGHGGAGLLDPWLVYVANALIHRQPRNASHSVDLALGGWFPDAADRAVLHFVRSRIVWHLLRDPKTASADLAAARPKAPDCCDPCLRRMNRRRRQTR